MTTIRIYESNAGHIFAAREGGANATTDDSDIARTISVLMFRYTSRTQDARDNIARLTGDTAAHVLNSLACYAGEAVRLAAEADVYQAAIRIVWSRIERGDSLAAAAAKLHNYATGAVLDHARGWSQRNDMVGAAARDFTAAAWAAVVDEFELWS